MYRCETTSVAGFVQQLAVSYVRHGHFFYVMGSIPMGKHPRMVDEKLIALYGIDVSRWSRARAKQLGVASVQYIRYARTFVLCATAGRHAFFELESGIEDVRRKPIRFAGYSIGFRRGVDRHWHVSVRIAPSEYLVLKSYLLDLAYRRSVEGFGRAFNDVPFERYAPVRRQLLNMLRAVNRKRKLAGWDPVPTHMIRLRRRIVRPFGVPIDEGSSNAAA